MPKATEAELKEFCARFGTNTAAQLLVLSELTDKPLEEVATVYRSSMDLVSKIYYQHMHNRE